MKLSNQVEIALQVINARLFKKRSPLVVSWALTYRCNLKCIYCAYPEKKYDELDTIQILKLIDELKRLGNKYIIFTGGEALLKEDIGKILRSCSDKSIYTVLNSNGTLVKDKIKEISSIDEIQLSLDGPRSIHDFIRNKIGVYEKVVEAAKICKDKGIKTRLITVISKYNFLSFELVLEIAESLETGVYFQPATENMFGDKIDNPAVAPVEDYRKSIEYLIREKKKGRTQICNSISGLNYLYNWPNPAKIFCMAGLLHCYIEPDGRIFTCDRFPNYHNFLLSIDEDFKSTFARIPIMDCSSCWCGAKTDFNLAGSFNVEAIMAMRKRIMKG